MSKRQYCPNCHYPQSVCVCDAVKPINNQTKIIVLQHPAEVKQAKNTVKLLTLGLTHCEVVIGEKAADFAQIKLYCEQQADEFAVLYPNKHSVELETHHCSIKPVRNLILLDGTWKKVYKIWQLNPWLHNLPSCHFANPPDSIYQRKTKLDYSLSTLEACSYALNLIEKTNYAPLMQLLRIRQSRGF